jgi:zinc protease
MKKTLTILLCFGFLCVLSGLAQVEKPSDLKYPSLKYEPPDPKDFRTEFLNGMKGYIKEDRNLPLFDISALIHYGNLYDPEGKAGLASVMGGTLIKGGTKTREGSEIEERIDFIGGSLNFRTNERTATLSLSLLSKDLDEGLALFFDVLMYPEFREDALDLEKARLIAQLRQANDQPSSILNREYERLIYGEHPLTVQATQNSYDSITSADLKEIHARYFFPKNIILAVSGDFDKTAIKNKIDKIIADWKNKKLEIPVLEKKFQQPEPGVYFIQKQINQGYISLGHLGIEDTNPDYFAVQVMNFILGGGSFTSRITMKVRSDEGLSYNQGSRFRYLWGFPGTFAGYVQTKSSTVGYAISLILDEFKRIRKELVSDEEMDTAVNYYLESFSNSFESSQRTMSAFADLEMTGKSLNYYKTYRDNIRAVTKERVLEVAKKYIHPEKAVIMIVGDFEPCNEGGDKWLGPLEKLGKIHKINLKDPMTGEELR